MPSPFHTLSLIQALELSNIANDLLLSTAVLMAYSQLLNIHHEFAFVWKHPTRLSSVLYFFMRYPPLVYGFVTFLEIPTNANCNQVIQMSNWFFLVGMAASYVCQIAHIWAIYGKNIWIVIVLTIICLPAIGVEIETAVETNCLGSSIVGDLQRNIILVVDLVFESAVIAALFYRTGRTVSTERSLTTPHRRVPSVSALLLQNGLIYYSAFTITNIGALIFFNVNGNYATGVLFFLCDTLNHPVRWVCLSQFIIQLRLRFEQRVGDRDDTIASGTAARSGWRNRSTAFGSTTAIEDFGSAMAAYHSKLSHRHHENATEMDDL